MSQDAHEQDNHDPELLQPPPPAYTTAPRPPVYAPSVGSSSSSRDLPADQGPPLYPNHRGSDTKQPPPSPPPEIPPAHIEEGRDFDDVDNPARVNARVLPQQRLNRVNRRVRGPRARKRNNCCCTLVWLSTVSAVGMVILISHLKSKSSS